MKEMLPELLTMMAPGKPLRKGLDRIMDANLGVLMFFVEDAQKYIDTNVIQLGFKIDIDFEPEKLYELAKMDGAIVLNRDGSRILYANVQLNTDSSIPSSETGMRHRTAHKLAIQSQKLVIAVSKRRSTISAFYGKEKYELLSEAVLFSRLNQEITIAQRYKQNFYELIEVLNSEESSNTVSLYDVSEIISKGLLTVRITQRSEIYLKEMGDLAGSAYLEHREILSTVPKVLGAIIIDYTASVPEFDSCEEALSMFDSIKTENLLDLFLIAQRLGYKKDSDEGLKETILTPRAFRLLYSTKLPQTSIKTIIGKYENLTNLLNVSLDDLSAIGGIGKRKARIITSALMRKKMQNEFEGGSYQ